MMDICKDKKSFPKKQKVLFAEAGIDRQRGLTGKIPMLDDQAAE
jgi:hypothetical protein